MSHLGLANPLLEASLQCGANPDSLSDILVISQLCMPWPTGGSYAHSGEVGPWQGDGLDETLKTAAREVMSPSDS